MSRKFTIMSCHLGLMVLLIFVHLRSAKMIIAGEGGGLITEIESISPHLVVGVNILYVLTFICGIIYLWRDYEKSAAKFYKAFMVMAAVLNILICINVISDKQIAGTMIILTAAKVTVLLLLAFWKDLGRLKSWILFYILLALDIAVVVILTTRFYTSLYQSFIFILSRLVFDSTIGLTIRGKYVDKAIRGTK